MKLETTTEKILAAAETSQEAKNALKLLFPEAFEYEKVFCRIGKILVRKGHQNHYALFKWNGEVRFLNVTNNKFWDQDRNLKVSALKDFESVTIAEFQKLIGNSAVYHDFQLLK